jgi:hypothetical protein
LWFFNTREHQATGRTYLYAVVCLELAKQGQTVRLNDLSHEVSGPAHVRAQHYFIDTVMDIARTHYPRECFEFRRFNNTLVYRGRVPR